MKKKLRKSMNFSHPYIAALPRSKKPIIRHRDDMSMEDSPIRTVVHGYGILLRHLRFQSMFLSTLKKSRKQAEAMESLRRT